MSSEIYLPRDRHYLFRLIFSFLVIALGCLLIGSLFQLLYFYVLGVDSSSVLGSNPAPRHLRSILLISQLFSFLIPALLFAWIAFKRKMFAFLGFSGKIEFQWIILAVTMLICLLPIIQFSYELNQALPLPEWMTQMEDDASEILAALIKMDTVWQLIINMLLIALLPAIGEELVFRGVIQRIGYRLFRKPVVSVWMTAFIFSAIHFQFEGFIPRFLLGLYLGYIYYWTRSIYIPMAAHFFNNGFMVLLSYFKPEMISDLDETAAPDLPWYGVIVSIALIIPLIFYFRNVYIQTSDNQNNDPL